MVYSLLVFFFFFNSEQLRVEQIGDRKHFPTWNWMASWNLENSLHILVLLVTAK